MTQRRSARQESSDASMKPSSGSLSSAAAGVSLQSQAELFDRYSRSLSEGWFPSNEALMRFLSFLEHAFGQEDGPVVAAPMGAELASEHRPRIPTEQSSTLEFETSLSEFISIDLRAAEEFDCLVGYARRDAELGLRKARALAASPTKCCSGRDNSQ